MSKRKARHNVRTRAARQDYVARRAAGDVPNLHPSDTGDHGFAASPVQLTPPAFHNAPKNGGQFNV
jgi:hypothetical protein